MSEMITLNARYNLVKTSTAIAYLQKLCHQFFRMELVTSIGQT